VVEGARVRRKDIPLALAINHYCISSLVVVMMLFKSATAPSKIPVSVIP